MSGGEKVMAETVRYFASESYQNVILTTDNGMRAYTGANVPPGKLVKYFTIPSFAYEQSHHIFLSYLHRLPQIFRLLRTIDVAGDAVILCHSNFFPNSIAAWVLGRRNPKAKMLYWHHTLPPGLFRGYKGEFTGEFNLPSLALIHYHLNQILYCFLHRKDGIVLTPNRAYLSRLKRRFKQKIVLIEPFGGLDGDLPVKQSEKSYDIAWMGRFQKLKGVEDLLEIAKQANILRPGTTFLIIGGGTKSEELNFRRKLLERELNDVVDYKGFMNGTERYKELSRARVLAVTSSFESNPIVNIEALKIGLPIICYYLPTYAHIQSGLIRINIGDIKEFSTKIVSLLNDPKTLGALSREAAILGKKYSWVKTNQQIEKII